MGKICLGRLNIRKSPSNFLISTWYHSCFVANRASTIHRRNFLQQNLATSFLRTQGSINPSRMQRSANKFKVEKCLGFFGGLGMHLKRMISKNRSEVFWQETHLMTLWNIRNTEILEVTLHQQAIDCSSGCVDHRCSTSPQGEWPAFRAVNQETSADAPRIKASKVQPVKDLGVAMFMPWSGKYDGDLVGDFKPFKKNMRKSNWDKFTK